MISGGNLTNVNYAGIGEQVKFIDTMKYYQHSLTALSMTITPKEKSSIKKVSQKYLKQHDDFRNVWQQLDFENRKNILELLAFGKGVIPYEKIKDFDSLSVVPENGDFFKKSEFFSELKNLSVSDSEYEDAQFFYKILPVRNLSNMNDLYNVQDVILLCKIFEHRVSFMHEMYDFNPRHCNLASTFSGGIERYKYKVIIALPTCLNIIQLFKKALIGGFSCVNTRVAFDTEIVLPNLSAKDMNNSNIDQSFKQCNRQDLKIGHRLELDGEECYIDRRIISKILKMDENNQYGQAITKPMPTGCIKEKRKFLAGKISIYLSKKSVSKIRSDIFIPSIIF